jgi:hypothetical protein
MMPMRMRRKPRALEKVEINCRTATAEHIVPATRALPEISHFGAKFYECCAGFTPHLRVFPKFGGIRANLLAMQRGGP